MASRRFPATCSTAAAVGKLPDAPNILFLAGQKFGTTEGPELTWAMNTLVPAHVAERYAGSRIVAFSTGCVYSFAPVTGNGSREEDPTQPIGDYANSCLGRERIFSYYARKNGRGSRSFASITRSIFATACWSMSRRRFSRASRLTSPWGTST